MRAASSSGSVILGGIMEIPTIEGVQAVKDFTDDLIKQKSLLLYLSETPIGDEYNVLTAVDRVNGEDFELWASGRGIRLWSSYYDSPEAKIQAMKSYDAEWDRVERAIKG